MERGYIYITSGSGPTDHLGDLDNFHVTSSVSPWDGGPDMLSLEKVKELRASEFPAPRPSLAFVRSEHRLELYEAYRQSLRIASKSKKKAKQ